MSNRTDVTTERGSSQCDVLNLLAAFFSRLTLLSITWERNVLTFRPYKYYISPVTGFNTWHYITVTQPKRGGDTVIFQFQRRMASTNPPPDQFVLITSSITRPPSAQDARKRFCNYLPHCDKVGQFRHSTPSVFQNKCSLLHEMEKLTAVLWGQYHQTTFCASWQSALLLQAVGTWEWLALTSHNCTGM
jgi:hypothetical protein